MANPEWTDPEDWEDTAEQIAAKLTPLAKRALLWPWPLHARWLHHRHRRWFHRQRLIEDHSAAYYRLTPLGQQVRDALLVADPPQSDRGQP